MHSQLFGYWWPDNIRSQVVSNYAIDLVWPEKNHPVWEGLQGDNLLFVLKYICKDTDSIKKSMFYIYRFSKCNHQCFLVLYNFRFRTKIIKCIRKTESCVPLSIMVSTSFSSWKRDSRDSKHIKILYIYFKQLWFSFWLGTNQTTSHNLNQCWPLGIWE